MGKRNSTQKNLLFDFFRVILCRFGNLSVYYPSLPVSVRSCLAEAMCLSRGSPTAQDVSNILLGLSNSQANWDDLEERACEGIVKRMRSTISVFDNQVTRPR
jgi:hypothetical protein